MGPPIKDNLYTKDTPRVFNITDNLYTKDASHASNMKGSKLLPIRIFADLALGSSKTLSLCK